MNLIRTVIDDLSEIITRLDRFSQPADQVLRSFFREHPRLGGKERARLAEAAFAWLRHRRSFFALAGQAPRANAVLVLHRTLGWSGRQLAPVLSPREIVWLEDRLSHAPAADPALEAELPDWLYARLVQQWGTETSLGFARSSLLAAPLDLRVNRKFTNREALQAQLLETGIPSDPTPFSPLGLRIRGRPALQQHPLFRAGHFEVQDEGSQLVALLVGAKRRQLVVDFCAGAGGKTLLLADAMQGQGQLFALDVVERRLRNLRDRVARSGQSNVQPWRIADLADPKLDRLRAKADRVLVDAPCSGFGTLRRNPDLKWRHDEKAISELLVKQEQILHAAAQLVKPGGQLIYATCSVLQEENESQVESFLAAHSAFRLHPAEEILAAERIPLETGAYLQLRPETHGCDGFFAAVLERQA